jgi:23S rRNA (guanosine2251-2'-O)-methyltransferase
MPHLVLRNPHSILAVFDTRPQDVFEVRLERGRPSDVWQQVADRARQAGVTVHQAAGGPTKPQRGEGQRGGGSEAAVRERQGIEQEALFAVGGTSSGLWLGLDQLQDPHNVGAVFRTAAFFGVRGIVLTRDRSAPLSATVYDVASGGIEHVPFSIQTNLSRTVEVAKQAGLWVLGTSEHAERDIAEVDRDRRWLILVGNEERGLRRLGLDVCDETCRITPRGPVGSLNVSVATALTIAALSRSLERHGAKPPA